MCKIPLINVDIFDLKIRFAVFVRNCCAFLWIMQCQYVTYLPAKWFSGQIHPDKVHILGKFFGKNKILRVLLLCKVDLFAI